MHHYTVSGSPNAEAVRLLLDRIYSCLAEREQELAVPVSAEVLDLDLVSE